jgi:uncharacterized protein YbgA (DUF1722 family)/uncharacterized protein YbbK (DUF523 family)
MTAQTVVTEPIRIGISACLLGEKVRFDGGHKEDRYITKTLSRYFEWVPVCPEVELGLGTPRETIRLVRLDAGVGFVTTKSGRDHTAAMQYHCRHRVQDLEKEDLGGYILKSDSPSCGMERVRVYDPTGMPARNGRGLFAAALIERFPDLPVEEEGRLSDPRIRENWIERVFAYRRLKELWNGRWTIGRLVEFHTAHKLVLLAHSPEAYRSLGRLVGGAQKIPRQELRASYQAGCMQALKTIATRGRHANVLQHIAGYMKKHLDDDAKAELHESISDYQRGILPLIVPMTLINHYVRRLDVPYLRSQIYLSPHPRELSLRNQL